MERKDEIQFEFGDLEIEVTKWRFSINRMNLVKNTELEFSVGDELRSNLSYNMISDTDVYFVQVAEGGKSWYILLWRRR